MEIMRRAQRAAAAEKKKKNMRCGARWAAKREREKKLFMHLNFGPPGAPRDWWWLIGGGDDAAGASGA